MSDNIEVVVRVRPLLPRESGDTIHWKVVPEKNSLIQVTALDKSSATYVFDQVYDTSCNNGQIYQNIVQPIVAGALNGINGTVFAYGQTSSGKTHTMMGDETNPGIIPLTIRNIFQGIEDTPDRQYLVRASYMEIYNEQIADLLAGRSNIPGNKGLAVREDGSGSIYVTDLKEECVTEESKLLSIMRRGDRNRQVGCTNMNDRSSRSHTIFRIIVESQCAVDGDESMESGEDDMAVTVSHLNLVDLAGSENAAQTGATGDRLKEGGYINKSLFMLGRVISQLSEGESFVNFRDSKLTRILQCSLGGNARTAIICTVTPVTVDQTHSTLRFASRAKNIKNKPIVNEVLSEAALLKRYSKEIKILKTTLEKERQGNRADEVLQVKEKLDELEQMNEDLKSKVLKLNKMLVTSSVSRTPKRTEKKTRSMRRETWAAPVQKTWTAPLPLDLASINAKFSAPFPPLSAGASGTQQKRSMLPVINETPSVSDCSFATAEEFNDTNSSFMRQLDQSAVNRLDSSVLELSSTDIFPLARSSKPKVSFASPTLSLNDETLDDDPFQQPQSNITRRRRGKRLPPPPPKIYLDAEVQTDNTLAPKLNLLCSPRTPRRADPPSSPDPSTSRSQLFPSTPVGETPRMALRARITKLSSVLAEKDGRVDDLKQELHELQELHRFVEEDYRFREESLLAKMDEEPTDVTLEEMVRDTASLKRSLHDSEGLLLDANKRLSEQTQQLQCQALELEQLREENSRLSAVCRDGEDVKMKCNSLQADHDSLVKELHEKRNSLNVLEKDRQDFDLMLELRLEKHQRIERDLRKSLEEAWSDMAKVESGDSGIVKARLERTADLENQLRERDVAMKELQEQINRSSEFEQQKMDLQEALKCAHDAEEKLNTNLLSKELEIKLLKSYLQPDAAKLEALAVPSPNEASPLQPLANSVNTQDIDSDTLPAGRNLDGDSRVVAASDNGSLEKQEKSKVVEDADFESHVETLTLKCRELERLLACKEELCVQLNQKLSLVIEKENNITLGKSSGVDNIRPTDVHVEEESMKADSVVGETLSDEKNCTNCDTLEKRLESLKQECHDRGVEKGTLDCGECEKLASSVKEQEAVNQRLVDQVKLMESTIAELEEEIKSLKSSLENVVNVDGSKTNCDIEIKDSHSESELALTNTSLIVGNKHKLETLVKSDNDNAALITNLQDEITELKREKQEANLLASKESASAVDTVGHLEALEMKNVEWESKTKDLAEQIVCHVSQQRLMEARVEELGKTVSRMSEENAALFTKLDDASELEVQLIKFKETAEDVELEKANLSTQVLLLEKSLSQANDEIATLKKQLSYLQQGHEEAQQTPVVTADGLENEIEGGNEKSLCGQSLCVPEQLDAKKKMEELVLQIANLKSENERLCDELEEIESLNLDHMSLKQEIEDMTEEVERLKENKKEILEDNSATEKTELQLREKELSSLRQEVTALKSELEKVSTELNGDKTKDTEPADTALFNHLQDELAKLKDEKMKLQCQMDELSATEADKRAENAEKDLGCVSELNEENKKLMMEIEELKALNDRESYESFIEELNTLIKSLEQDKMELLAELQALRKVNAQKIQVDVELRTLANEHANLLIQRDKLLLDLEESEVKRKSCSSSEGLKKEISDLTQEKLSLSIEVETMRARLCSDADGADLDQLTKEGETNSSEKTKLLEMIANLSKGVSVEEEPTNGPILGEEEVEALRLQLKALEKCKTDAVSELQEVNHLKQELATKLTAELLETKRQKHELELKLQHFNQQAPGTEMLGVSHDGHDLENQQLETDIQELTRRKEALVSELQEINRQKQDLLAELQQLARRRNTLLDETDDIQTTLLAAASSKRKGSGPRRRMSSVSTLKDESCLLQDSMNTVYTGDDTCLAGHRSTKAALSAVSHRLLHTITMMEESFLQPAMDRTDINATLLTDRTVIGEEFSAEQLQEVRDQLLELQRALLASSLTETSADAPTPGDCCWIVAENEVECHTLRLLESIASDYMMQGSEIYSSRTERPGCLTENVSAFEQLETTHGTSIATRVHDAGTGSPTTDHNQSQCHGLKHAPVDQTVSGREDGGADSALHVDESIDVTDCPEMFDATDYDITMGVTLRDNWFGGPSKVFDASCRAEKESSPNIARPEHTRVMSLAEEMQMVSDDSFVAPDALSSNEAGVRQDAGLPFANELRLADEFDNNKSLVAKSGLSLADELSLADISGDKTLSQENDHILANCNRDDESTIIEASLSSDGCVSRAELTSATQASPNLISATSDGEDRPYSDDLSKELGRVRKENLDLVEQIKILNLALEQHKNSLNEKMVLLTFKEKEFVYSSEQIDNDYIKMDGPKNEGDHNIGRQSSNVSEVKYDDSGVHRSDNESQLFDQSIQKECSLEVSNSSEKDLDENKTEELLQKVIKQEADNESLKRKLSEANLVVEEVHCLRWQATDLEEQKKALELEIEELKDALQESGRTTPSSMDYKVEGDANIQIEKNDEYKDIVEQFPESIMTTDELELRFEGVFKKLDNKETKLEAFESQMSSLEEIVQLQASSSSSGENRLVNSQQLYRVLAEKHRLAAELKRLKENIDVLEDREALEDNVEKALEQLNETRYEKDLLSRKFEDTNEDLAVRTAMLESLTSKYEDHMKECDLKLSSLCDEKNKQQKEEARLSLLLTEKEAALQDVSTKLDEKNLQVTDLEIQLESMTKTNEAFDNLKETLLGKDDLISELNQKICEHESIKTELEENIGSEPHRLQSELYLRGENLKSLSSQLVQVKEQLDAVNTAKEELSNLVKDNFVKVSSALDSHTLGSSNPAEFAEVLDTMLSSFETKCHELKQKTTAVQNLQIIVDKKTKEVLSNKEEHESEIQKLLQILESKDSEIRETVEAFEKAKHESEAQLKHQLNLKVNQLQQIEHTAEELEQELKLKEMHIENLLIQISSDETKISRMTEDMEALSSKLNEIKVESDRKSEAIETLNSELSAMKGSRKQLETLRDQLEDSYGTCRELEDKLADSVLKIEERQAALDTLRGKCTDLELFAESTLKQKEQCQTQNAEQARDIDRLNRVVEKHELEIAEKDSKLKTIEFEHFACMKKVEEKESVLDVETVHKMCTQQLSAVHRDLSDLQTEHSLCRQKLSEKYTELSAIQDVHNSCEQSMAKKDARLTSVQDELKRTYRSASETSAKLNSLMKEHSECANKFMVLQGETKVFNHLEKEIAVLKLKLSQQEQGNAVLSQECYKYQKCADEMKQALEQHRALKDKSVEQLQHKLDVHLVTTDQLRKECEELQVKYDELLESVQSVDKVYELWNTSQKDQLVENIVKLHKSKTGGCSESFDAEKQVVVEQLRKEVADLEQRLQTKEEEHIQLDEELNEIVKHFEKRIKGYDAERGEMPAKIFDLTQENQKYKTEINQLTKKLKRLEQNLDLFNQEKDEHEKNLSHSVEQLKSQEQLGSVATLACSADSEQWNARVQTLENELKRCQEQLVETEQERKRLDETVAHYEKRIDSCAELQRAEAAQAEKLRQQTLSDAEEKAKLSDALDQLRREKQGVQQRLQAVDKLYSQKKLSETKNGNDSRDGPHDTSPGLSSCGQRAARQQQLANFESRSHQDREMTELKDRLHFAETNMARYRDELRRLQNSGPLNNTMCQLQSSKPAQSRDPPSAGNSPVHGFEGGSHIVLAELVTDLKRDVYQLEKENKSLKGEVNSITQHVSHYKTKAQEWKTSSLLHQRHTAKLKTELQTLKWEVERLKKRVEKSAAPAQPFDTSVLTQHALDSVSRAKKDSVLTSPRTETDSGGVTGDVYSPKVLQDANRIRIDHIQGDVLTKVHKKTENIPPSHDFQSVAATALVRATQHTSPIPFTKPSPSSSSNIRGGTTNNSSVTRSIGGTTSLVTRTVSGSAIEYTSPDARGGPGALTGSAAIIKGMRGGETGTTALPPTAPRGIETKDSSPVLTSSASVTRSGKPLRRNWEAVKSSNAKYFLPEDKPNSKDDCKTQ